MYKFLGKTWSYFMGLKDMFLLMLSVILMIFTVGIVYECRNSEGRMIIGKMLNDDKVSYNPVKKRPKMGFHVVETD